MACLLIALSLFMPRLILILVWLFGGSYLSSPFGSWIWPVLGFFFLPLTTLAYAFSWHQSGGSVGGLWIVLIVIAVLVDLGLIGGGAAGSRRSEA
ncbi:MAG: hypothetical protein KF724_12915 [Phycisphaeraceae bacterium]|nr:hypothetical protein [Phycisphaeraceae bacterium]